MHDIHSDNIPKEFAKYFRLRYTEHAFILRDCIRVEIPVIKNLRLSSSPIFKFVCIFNNFSEEFKLLREKKKFILGLNNYYRKKIKSTTCRKRFCRICDPYQFSKRQRSFLIFGKVYNYYRYVR